MNTPVAEVCEYTAAEISDAQSVLDFHWERSQFWDSSDAQDHLEVIIALKLKPRTTEEERRWNHRAFLERMEVGEPA